MFISDDIYTTSGPVKLYHCWTDKVTKFDSSSFYNWEQDNLPVYDLDERTFYLWEQLGYPTSSIPGVVLTVSADAPLVTCNRNIFRTVSAAIDALPQVINYPIIIEIANFGQMGDLVLNNFKFGPRGSLEIINRNFSKQEYSVSSALGLAIPQVSANYYNVTNTFNYVSSFTNYAGLATIPKITPLQGFLESSCLSISCAVFSSTYDARLSGAAGSLSSKLNAYISVWKPTINYNKSTLVIDDKNTINPYAVGNQYSLAFTPYFFNPESSDDVHNRDASTINYLTNSIITESNNTSLNPWRAFNGLYYGNKLFKIKVNNCDGLIILRNFFLDGNGNNSTENNIGVEINNSPNVFLENIVSTRYRKAGFYFNNSKVNLLRACVANRIYDYDSQGNRLTGKYLDRVKFYSRNDASGYAFQDFAAGLVANNSIISVSSTRNWELPRYRAILGSTYSALPVAYQIFEFNQNSNGIILNNSELTGGESVRPHLATDPNFMNENYDPSNSLIVAQTIIDLNSNTNCGLISNNSKISLNGKLRAIENLKGMELNSSQFDTEQIECARNQTIGIELNNSNGVYNKNIKSFHSLGVPIPSVGGYQNYFIQNGTHLVLNSSNLKPAITSSMELKYAEMIFVSAMGQYSGVMTEAIKVNNSSELTLISPKISRGDAQTLEGRAKKGSEINCVNNSKVTLRGTKYYPTRINGPTTRTLQKRLAAICANKNSTVDINGPTVIAQFGIDLLADTNSTINITSPKSDVDGVIDVSSINLHDPANHTMVELHSTRSCIVADNKSTINMKDLGSYRTRWEVTGVFDSYGLDYGGSLSPITNDPYYSTYVSGGSLQFYPNPNDDSTNTAQNVSSRLNNNFVKYPEGYGSLLDLQTTPVNDYSAVTFGGMCLRALNNSNVNVHNVNFPCGWWNPSAPYYDSDITFAGGGICNRTFIWNIADNSQLKASYVSVSGLFPRLSGYVGPYGYWVSAANNATYGAPSSTPDTSALSVLDIYGENPSGTPFTNSTATNYGPFRLYFSINPFVNTLTELNGSAGQGIIKQIYSQGYQPSSSLVCSGSVSSIYKMALQRNSSNIIAPSGFYYGSGVMDTTTFSRVMLDESAAETFANAKHCAAGRSGNARLVSIYFPYNIAKYGDSRDEKGVASVNVFDIERDN